MRIALALFVGLSLASAVAAQPSCDGGAVPCGITVEGVITEGSCPTGCLEFSQTHSFNVFTETTLVTLTATSSDFSPRVEVVAMDGSVLARRDGHQGEPTKLTSILKQGIYFAKVAATPAGSSGIYELHLACLIADPELFCSPDDVTLCLYNRFAVTTSIRASEDGPSVPGSVLEVGDRSGIFSAPLLTHDPSNPEILVKVLDGRAINGRWWVFFGGLTGFDFEITVRDTFLKRERTYAKSEIADGGGIDLITFSDR